MSTAQWKTIGILLLIISLLCGVLFLQSKTPSDTESQSQLLPLGNRQVVMLNFANASDYIYLSCKNGQWVMSKDAEFPVNQEAVQTLVSALSAARVETTISVNSQSELKQYNLLSPQCIIELGLSDGTSHGIRIGTMNSITDKIYALLDDDSSTVYVVSPELLQAFSCSKLDLIAYPVIPTPKEASKVIVTNQSGTITLEKTGDAWFLSTEDGAQPVSDETAYNFYMLPWDMHWRGVVEYQPKDLSAYDLSRPRISYSITYLDGGQEKTWSVNLGSSLPDGSCFAMIPNGNTIYLLDALMADWLDGLKAEDLVADSTLEGK